MMSRLALALSLLLLLLSVVAASPISQQFFDAHAQYMFNKWAKLHGRQFSSPAETFAKFSTFRENLDFIQAHNEAAANGLHTYTVALNKFADLTLAEYKATYLGFRPALNAITANHTKFLSGNPPASIDWRKKGAVTPIKDQGQCGSCWAFSATGALEGANFIKNKKLVALSEQELLDCDDVDNACNGGLMDNAFDFVKKNGGIDSEDDWKYLAKSDDKCPKDKEAKHVGTCTTYTDVPTNDESQLQLAAALQPVAIAIEADQQGFQFYDSGIFSGECGTNLDHGVLLVGYGTEDGQDYWIVKNSWGEEWGEQGYIRFARNITDKAGQCGLTLAASYPQA